MEQVASKIRKAVEQALSLRELPGGIILVERHQKPFLEIPFGVVDSTTSTAVAPTNRTVYDLASLTKPLSTGLAILQLADSGGLSLSDRVERWIPQWREGIENAKTMGSSPQQAAWKQDVRISHLLLHSSGLPAHVRLYALDGASGVPMEERQAWAAEKIAALPLRHEPGTGFIYSDMGYILLGQIIERASGMRQDRYFKERIAKPLGLNSTGYLAAEWSKDVAPTEYITEPTTTGTRSLLRGVVHDGNARWLGGVAGHAGLFSSASELAMLAREFHNDPYGRSGAVGLLSSTMRLNGSLPRAIPNGDGAPALRTYGWDYQTTYSIPKGDFIKTGICHTGWTGTSILIEPDTQNTVIILTNRVFPDGKGDAGPLRAAVANVVYLSGFWP